VHSLAKIRLHCRILIWKRWSNICGIIFTRNLHSTHLYFIFLRYICNSFTIHIKDTLWVTSEVLLKTKQNTRKTANCQSRLQSSSELPSSRGGEDTFNIWWWCGASFVWPFPSFSPTFCFRALLQLTHLFLFCSTPIADLYSLSYLWTSGLSFGAAVIFTVIGSFALGDYIQLASFNASFPMLFIAA